MVLRREHSPGNGKFGKSVNWSISHRVSRNLPQSPHFLSSVLNPADPFSTKQTLDRKCFKSFMKSSGNRKLKHEPGMPVTPCDMIVWSCPTLVFSWVFHLWCLGPLEGFHGAPAEIAQGGASGIESQQWKEELTHRSWNYWDVLGCGEKDDAPGNAWAVPCIMQF